MVMRWKWRKGNFLYLSHSQCRLRHKIFKPHCLHSCVFFLLQPSLSGYLAVLTPLLIAINFYLIFSMQHKCYIYIYHLLYLHTLSISHTYSPFSTHFFPWHKLRVSLWSSIVPSLSALSFWSSPVTQRLVTSPFCFTAVRWHNS